MQQFLSPATVQARRAELGLSTSELARRADVDRSSLANYELGHRGLGEDKLLRVADVLGLRVQQATPAVQQRRVAESVDPWLTDYRLPRNAAHALEFLSDDDLGKYIRQCIDNPSSMSETAFGAFMHEWTRRVKRDEKAKVAEVKYPTGAPGREGG